MNYTVRRRRSTLRFYVFVATCTAAALACARTDLPINYGNVTPVGFVTPFGEGGSAARAETAMPAGQTATLSAPTPVAGLPTATLRPTQDTSSSPTPDATRASVLQRQSVEEYTVQRGDTLGEIGEGFGVSATEIAEANGILITDTLFAGQVLRMPLPRQQAFGPDLKLLPDSEFVYGPSTVGFNLQAFVEAQRGYLAAYSEDVPGDLLDGLVSSATLSGSEIVRIVAQRYSIHPRLLLALLEHQSGWVTRADPGDRTLVYPLQRVEVGREGLFRQLNWAANQLNAGYYRWRVGAIVSWGFGDGGLRLVSPGLNAGTVGLQHFFAQVLGADSWSQAVSAQGFALTYARLFGNPFALAYEPLVPIDLAQPELILPFEAGRSWKFTGGPHGAWNDGSAWAALDFAPADDVAGCTVSDEWVTAAAPGVVTRSEYGAVLQDLDGDGYEGTGWVLFYMHVEQRDRVALGTFLDAGDRIGHPSCEGGFSNGTHVHLARKYNGEWISADRAVPFVLDGWVSAGLGREYDGTLTKGEVSIEACGVKECATGPSDIQRPEVAAP